MVSCQRRSGSRVTHPVGGATGLALWRGRGTPSSRGDNLDVLPTVPDLVGGPVDLNRIDPPYSTGNEFAYRDDFRGHAHWLAMMRPRLVAARRCWRRPGRSGSASTTTRSPTTGCSWTGVRRAEPPSRARGQPQPKGRQLGAAASRPATIPARHARDARRCVLDATSPDAVVDPRDFPLAIGRRAPVSTCHCQHNKVQPRHPYAALHGLGRPERSGRHDSFDGAVEIRAGLRRQPAGRVAGGAARSSTDGPATWSASACRGGWGAGGRVPARLDCTATTSPVAAANSARSGSPRRWGRPTPPCRAQDLVGHVFRVAEADRPGADPRHHAGRCGGARLLRGGQDDRHAVALQNLADSGTQRCPCSTAEPTRPRSNAHRRAAPSPTSPGPAARCRRDGRWRPRGGAGAGSVHDLASSDSSAGSGRVALVTGGSSGIGEETARRLRRAGFRVYAPWRVAWTGWPASNATGSGCSGWTSPTTRR